MLGQRRAVSSIQASPVEVSPLVRDRCRLSHSTVELLQEERLTTHLKEKMLPLLERNHFNPRRGTSLIQVALGVETMTLHD